MAWLGAKCLKVATLGAVDIDEKTGNVEIRRPVAALVTDTWRAVDEYKTEGAKIYFGKMPLKWKVKVNVEAFSLDYSKAAKQAFAPVDHIIAANAKGKDILYTTTCMDVSHVCVMIKDDKGKASLFTLINGDDNTPIGLPLKVREVKHTDNDWKTEDARYTYHFVYGAKDGDFDKAVAQMRWKYGMINKRGKTYNLLNYNCQTTSIEIGLAGVHDPKDAYMRMSNIISGF